MEGHTVGIGFAGEKESGAGPPSGRSLLCCVRAWKHRGEKQPTPLRCVRCPREGPHPYVPQPTKSVAPPLPPAVKGWVLAMLACGCAWLRSRCAPLTAVAASLFGRCRLRRNVGLCLTRGMRGFMEVGYPLPLSPSLDDAEALKSLPLVGDDRCRKRVGIHERRGIERNVELHM
jgi:hypothetical protein